MHAAGMSVICRNGCGAHRRRRLVTATRSPRALCRSVTCHQSRSCASTQSSTRYLPGCPARAQNPASHLSIPSRDCVQRACRSAIGAQSQTRTPDVPGLSPGRRPWERYCRAWRGDIGLRVHPLLLGRTNLSCDALPHQDLRPSRAERRRCASRPGRGQLTHRGAECPVSRTPSAESARKVAGQRWLYVQVQIVQFGVPGSAEGAAVPSLVFLEAGAGNCGHGRLGRP